MYVIPLFLLASKLISMYLFYLRKVHAAYLLLEFPLHAAAFSKVRRQSDHSPIFNRAPYKLTDRTGNASAKMDE